jgi:hypothetical protein
MLNSGHGLINPRKVFRGPAPSIFFEPVQLHRQLPDLLVELRDHLPLVHFRPPRRLEQLRQPLPNDTLPLRHLHRMDLVISGDLAHGLDPDQRLQAHFGFEGRTVSLSFR